MILRETITLIFWLLLSLFFCIESVRLGLGTAHAPGPGFFTFWIAIITILFVVILFLRERRKRRTGRAEPLEPLLGENVRNIIYGNVFLFAYGFLLNKIGFALCTVLFMGSCLKVIGKKKWVTTIAISSIVTTVAYALFVVWLRIPFPIASWVKQFKPF
jgi:putative tricarboxylic transport membrane protein